MTPDEELAEAQKTYHESAQRFSRAIERWVQAKVRDAYPTATKLLALGEHNEDSVLQLRAQQVVDAAGESLGDYDDPTVEFDTLADLIDPYLDWLADINGDDYVGDHEIDIEENPQ